MGQEAFRYWENGEGAFYKTCAAYAHRSRIIRLRSLFSPAFRTGRAASCSRSNQDRGRFQHYGRDRFHRHAAEGSHHGCGGVNEQAWRPSRETSRLFLEDDESQATNAVIAVAKLARDRKVAAIVGPSNTDSGMAMIPTCDQEQVPFVLTAPCIGDYKKWVFYLGAGDAKEGMQALEFAVKALGASE